EPLGQWQQEEIGHVWHEFVKHTSLTEQRMSTPPGGVGLEVPIVAQLFAGSAQERQQYHCEGIDQPQAIPPARRADMHRSEPHAEPEILCVAETALDLPPPGVQVLFSQISSFRNEGRNEVFEAFFQMLAECCETAHLIQFFDSTTARAHVSAAGAKGGSRIRPSAARVVA